MHRRREEDPLYKRFMREYEQDPYSSATRSLAMELTEKYGHRVGDHEAGLTEKGRAQAKETGRNLKEQITYPIHAIYVSSYRRCQETFECMLETWPELTEKVRVFSHDNEIVELDYGDVFPYGNWNTYFSRHPDQHRRFTLAGPYWYRYPNGENVPDMLHRLCSWYDRMITNFAERNIMVISHYGTILGLRANIEGWGEEEYVYHNDSRNTPHINCAVTEYKGVDSESRPRERELVLQRFNDQLYPDDLLSN